MLSSSSSWRKKDTEVVMEKKKYPIGAEYYSLHEEVGQGASASVHRAHCVPFDEIVAIKILDFERDKSDLNNISREAQTMTLVDHPNVLKSHCSFVSDHNLWVVMPFMSGGSCHHILKAVHPDGFEEVVIATILREVLKGLEYLHQHGHIHRDVKAGNIVLGARGSIKLADFGVSACLFDSGDRQRTRNTFVGTPCWMAPEVMQQLHGYDCKADIWSFGITALELAHGHAPFSKLPPMKVLLMTIQNAPPGLDYERDRKFSKSFKQMIASCLVKDPSKRPTAKKLLKHSFFKQARSNDYIARTLLDGLPDLGDRIRALKIKEEEMLAQQIMPDGEKEELSQNEYKRGISGWNFDLEDVKAQAALIQDEDPFADSNEDGSSSSTPALDQDKHTSIGHLPPLAELGDNDKTQDLPASLPPVHSNLNITTAKCEKSDDDSRATSPTYECSLSQSSTPCHNTAIENISVEKPDVEMNGKFTKEGSASHPEQRREGPSDSDCTSSDSMRVYRERDKLPNHPQSTATYNGVAAPPEADVTTETGEELAVVQQRGRFKVTSENVELEKAAPSPMLHKSYSMQVISQRSSASLPSPPSDATSSNHLAHSFLPMLNLVLQTNISQTEAILGLIKRASATGIEFTANHDAGRNIPPYINVTEKSMMEAALDREKKLISEINELNRRLISAQEELQKLKAENAQV